MPSENPSPMNNGSILASTTASFCKTIQITQEPDPKSIERKAVFAESFFFKKNPDTKGIKSPLIPIDPL